MWGKLVAALLVSYVIKKLHNRAIRLQKTYNVAIHCSKQFTSDCISPETQTIIYINVLWDLTEVE